MKLILVDSNPRARQLEVRAGYGAWSLGEPIAYEAGGLRGKELFRMCKSVVDTGKPWIVEDVIYDSESNIIGVTQIHFFRLSSNRIANAFLDISEQYMSDKEIRELNQILNIRVRERTAELSAVNQELEAFAYSVSHDLRAPLRAIDGFSQAVMEDCFNELNETGQDHLLRVRKNVSRMTSIIDGLLHLSKITRSEMERSSVDLSALADEIANELTESEPARVIEVQIDKTAPARCDPRLMRLVLENLFGNAWKFTRNASHPKVEFGSTMAKDKTVYFVRDNGAGFDMQHENKLFTPFQRLHSSQDFSGSGIGLATVRRVINRHGGRIWAESDGKSGATFYFTIPS